MSFRGKPSKACERCRARRLKCDLTPVTCGSCIRARVICTGYRDIEKLRIRDETGSLYRKATTLRRRTDETSDGRDSLLLKLEAANTEPRYLPVALEVQAKDLFFDHYILAGQINGSRAWDFLKPYYQLEKAPVCLQLTIDAASLAYLSHQFGSQKARVIALERYIGALGVMSKVLESPEISKKMTTLFTTLLLDLFEKLSTTQPFGNRGWSSHLRGALAISEICGDQFTTSSTAMRAFTRLSTNLLITSLAGGTTLPSGFFRLRECLENSPSIDVSRNPKWQLVNIMAQYVNLQSNIQNGKRARESSLREARELDSILTNFSERDAKIKQIFKAVPSGMAYGNFYYSYPDRHSTQTWNVVRLAHVKVVNCLMLNATTETDRSQYLTKVNEISSKICASVPQYLDCMGAVKSLGQIELLHPVATSRNSCTSHTPSHKLTCYTLIFPLYVAGFVNDSDSNIWKWAIEKLYYIGSHFGIRNAELVAQILEKRSENDPWKVYTMLGSYAFGA
ncbi:hypothetical protein BOTNAR_0139g00120 [Botryotinia narcissicola]|uniref:Zn(2)-C6 fungal-type domain-containing protein n=1 Tax=Botryotinia narcissicola TaxID=278944 RepID=A0A4Z1IJY0_9HELO|nr:hypothetical protein BOTNAR_0139g00120 [Botryotinia narcissicola]